MMLVVLLALLPAACTTPKPLPKPAPPVPEAAAPPPVHAARPILRAAWSFQSGPDACVALAKAGAGSLEIAVRPQGLIRLTVRLPGTLPAATVAHFSGPAGRWLIHGSNTGRSGVLFTLDRDETSLSRILILLSGGSLNLEAPTDDLPILSLPESGPEGQQWFACVRRIVIWT